MLLLFRSKSFCNFAYNLNEYERNLSHWINIKNQYFIHPHARQRIDEEDVIIDDGDFFGLFKQYDDYVYPHLIKLEDFFKDHIDHESSNFLYNLSDPKQRYFFEHIYIHINEIIKNSIESDIKPEEVLRSTHKTLEFINKEKNKILNYKQ